MKLRTFAFLGLAVATGAFAASEDRSGMYLTDSSGKVVMNATDLCWRTSSWTAPSPATASEADCLCEKVCKPAPVAVIAPAPIIAAKPVDQKMSVLAETLFDFNKTTIRPAGADKLNEVVAIYKRSVVEVIIVVGHADRIGSEAYNQVLSEKRAAAVKAFLVSKGVAANRIYSEGKGEREPVTKAGQCRGAKNLKACLQPDRRVEIEIIGTVK